MKLRIVTALMLAGFLLQTCQTAKKEDPKPSSSISVPSNFNINIPSSINGNPRNLRQEGARMEADTVLNGNVIYEGLRGYIKVGNDAGNLVTQIIAIIRKYNLTTELDVTYVDDDDKRTKRIAVTKSGTYDGTTYEYKILFRDSTLGLTAMEIFFNTAPVKGTAILSFSAINPKETVAGFNTMYRVAYSEAPGNGFDKQMDVYASGIPTTTGLTSLRMTVQQKGTNLVVFGNSNHPNVMAGDLALGTINYAFRAKVNTTTNTAAAEISLPQSTLTSFTDADMGTYSVKNVLKNAAIAKWGTAIIPFVDKYLKNTNPPGFFNEQGFAAAETTTLSGFDGLTPLNDLLPFIPKTVADLSVSFSR